MLHLKKTRASKEENDYVQQAIEKIDKRQTRQCGLCYQLGHNRRSKSYDKLSSFECLLPLLHEVYIIEVFRSI